MGFLCGASMSIDTGNNPAKGFNYLKQSCELCLRAGLRFVEPFISDVVGNYSYVMAYGSQGEAKLFYLVARGPAMKTGPNNTGVVSVSNTLQVLAKGNDRPIVMAVYPDPSGPVWYAFLGSLIERNHVGYNMRGDMKMINFPLSAGLRMESPRQVGERKTGLLLQLNEEVKADTKKQTGLGRYG